MLQLILLFVTVLAATTPAKASALPIPPNYQHLTPAEVATHDCWLEEPPPTNQSSFWGEDRPLLKCHWTNRIQSAYDTNDDLYMDWNVTVSCPSSRSKTVEDFPTAKSVRQQAFELWNEDECTCQVNEVVKYRQNQAGQTEEIRINACSCTLCPYGYGKSHVSLDCSSGGIGDSSTGIQVQTGQDVEPILDNCNSFDCNHACNGDCGLTCENAGPECCLCRKDCPELTAAPTTAPPTLTPIDTGDDDLKAKATWPPANPNTANKDNIVPGSTAVLRFGNWVPWAVAGLSLFVGVFL